MLPKKKTDTQLTGIIKFDSNLWKNVGNREVQEEFKQRFDKIKKEYEELLEEVYWNQKIYDSEIRFEPVVGEIYHLYERDDSSCFLSIISPSEWHMKYLGSFKLKFNRKWEKVNLSIKEK